MPSLVESCNIALSHIRARAINALTESSIEAQQCKLHAESVRDIILRDTDWPMARKTAALALLTDTPLEWSYAYQYPSDALAIRRVVGDWAFKGSDLETRLRHADFTPQPENAVPFAINYVGDTRVIVTDLPEAYAVYTRRVTDFNLWNVDMRAAFEWLLASRLAIPVVGGDYGRKVREDALTMYRVSLDAAIVAAGNEQKRPARREPSMIAARR